MANRRTALRAARLLDERQILDGITRCERGDLLYGEKRVRFDGDDMRLRVFFYHYQPRAKRLWISRVDPGRGRNRVDREHLRHMTLKDAVFHQLARTEVEVRRRSMKLNHKGANT